MLVATMAWGQSTTSDETERSDWKFGGELDVLSYATKALYGSFFAGRDAWRGRAIVSRVNVPGFVIPDGFDKRRVDAYAIAVDRFFGAKRNNLEGFWVGPGIGVATSGRYRNTSTSTPRRRATVV